MEMQQPHQQHRQQQQQQQQLQRQLKDNKCVLSGTLGLPGGYTLTSDNETVEVFQRVYNLCLN